MSLTIVVNGGGTFTASMEEGPVSFTASLAAVGPAGPQGATGPGVAVGGATGQVLAKASGTDYDTEWVARNPFDQELNTTDSVAFAAISWDGGNYNLTNLGLDGYDGTTTVALNYDSLTFAQGGLGITTIYGVGGITFPDSTAQSTALPSGIADGYIVAWDADNSTYLSVPNDARTLFITARNITGTTIPKGSVVLITGASGNRPTIGLAQGNTSSNADGVIGITDAAINNNANGRVITEGLADNLDTSAFAAGDKLYLSATTPGGLVNVRPVQPAHSVAVGVVTRSNPAVGSIEVRVQVGEHLEFLHDVLLTSKANLDLLSYETSSGLWKNKSFSTLGLLTSATAASTYLTTSTAASTYAPIASPTFTGTVTIPAGASISGFLTTATAASTYAAKASTNTFTASQVIEVTDNSTAALRVTQLGTGEAFRVEDSANPDGTPFVITADGAVGIGGVPFSGAKLRVDGRFQVFAAGSEITTTSASNVFNVNQAGTGSVMTVTNTATATGDALRITNLGSGNSFVVEDSANPDSTPFVITAAGNVGVGTASPGVALAVAGRGSFNSSSGAGGDAVLSVLQTSTGSAAGCLYVENRGTSFSLRVEDQASDTTPFIVDAGGNVGVKTASPSTDFEVAGNAKFTTGNITTAPAAADSSSLIPTTAWVQAEVPAASTTAAGKVELATSAETDAKSSSTLAVTPAALVNFVNAPQWSIPDISGSTAVVATGVTYVGSAGVRLVLNSSGSASGQHAARYFGSSANAVAPNFIARGTGYTSLSKRILLCAKIRLQTASDAVHRLTYGKLSSGAVGDLAVKGFGFRVNGTGAVELQVHDGTNLANVTSSFTPTSLTSFDAVIENVGNGTVNLYINDSLVATSSAGGSGEYTNTTIPTIWMETELTGSIASGAVFMTNNIYLGTVS